MIKITRPNMTLYKDGVEVSSHRSEVEAMERASQEPGEYVLVRPDATINVDGEIVEPEPEPNPEPEPAPEPEPEPTPTPEPEPEPPGKPADIEKTFSESAALNFDWWNWATSRYSRYTTIVVLTGDTADIKFKLQNITTWGGGRTVPMSGAEYTLYIDGVPNATVAPSGGKTTTVTADLTQLEDGWHIMSLSEFGEETCAPYPVYVLRGDTVPQQDWMPVYTSSHEIHDRFHLKWVPAKHAPKPMPLQIPATDYIEFDTAANNLTVDALVGTITGHPRWMVEHKTGVLGTGTKQRYFWSDLVAKEPNVEMIDGPRGCNSLSMVTHLEVGNATFGNEPDSPIVGNVYFCTPWSFGKIRASGEVVTLAGWRHNSPPNYFSGDTPRNLELIGDWSAIDSDRRQFRELWGMCWLTSTLETNLDADPIPEEANLRPHHTAPVAIVADSQMDALRSIEFSATQHGAVPTIREFYRGEENAHLFDCVSWGDKVIASERGKHRIIQLDSDGNLERVVVEGADLAGADRDQLVWPRSGVTLEQLQAEDVVSPEGLYVLDDWLYFASSVQRQIKRVHLISGELEVIRNSFGNRRNFAKIAVSDGTAGPKGTVFVVSWEVAPPAVYLPDGTEWKMPYGGGGMSYGCTVAAKHGRILYSSVMQGIKQARLPLPTDKAKTPLYHQGHDEWKVKGYHLSHGESGESPFGLPLPWGESAAIDEYLTVLGHVQ